MIVVSDSSPLIALNAVGRLHLLADVYERVSIPEAVHIELSVRASDSARIFESSWLTCHALSDRRMLASLAARQIGAGEAEAIALAVELDADRILIDDRRARQTAEAVGLKVVGLLGVLVIAKRQGTLPMVAPVIEDLGTMTSFRTSPALIRQILESVGESSA